MKTRQPIRRFLIPSAIILAASHARAVDYTWDAGAGISRAWQLSANWAGDPALTFDENANIIFYSAINNNQSVLGDADRTIGSLTFNSSATTAMTLFLASSNTDSSSTARTLTFGGASPSITVDAASATHTIGTVKGDIALVGNLTATINGNAGLNIVRPISGTGFGFTKLGTGTLTLTGDSAFTGDFILGNGTVNASSSNVAATGSGGFLDVGHNNALGAGKVLSRGAQLRATTGGIVLPNAIDVETGGLRLGGTNDFDISGDVKLVGSTRTFTVIAPGSTVTLSGGVSQDTGTRGLTKDGNGTLIISGTGSYTGNTVVAAGTLQYANQASLYDNTPANWTAAKINVKSGATLALNVDSAGTDGFTAASLNTLLGNISVAGSATAGLQAGAKLGLDTGTATGGTFTQGDAIADSTGTSGGIIGLSKLGSGTLVLDKANTYTGGTNIADGVVLVASGSALGSGAVTVTGNATLGATTNGVVLSNDIAINSGVTLTAQTSNPINLTLAGDLTGSGTLQGSDGSDVYRLFLNGDNSAFTGTVVSRTTSAGSGGLGMRFANGSASLPNGTLQISSAIPVELNSAGTYSFGTVTDAGGGGFKTTGAGVHTLLIGGNNNSSSISGAVTDGTGSIALTKTGSGALTLSNAANTYSEATIVSAGTLYVSGALANSAVTVQADGTIGSNGSSGTLGSGLTIEKSGKLDLTNATIAANSTGILGLTGGSLTLGDLTFQDIVGWDWLNAAPGTYELIDGTFSIDFGGTVFLSEGTAYDFGNGKSGYFTSGSLNAVIIPEPSTFLLSGLGALLLLRRRR
ncbi:autotransporter-associated beta strand repeat-containing protein [Akkermansiaceae bacterium]|nr:autotransporter-associated beta strand repeat-containing protein [Akkermansiaceae bacterium]